MTGPGPKQEGAALVVEPNEDYSLVLEALESQVASVHYTERMLGITAKQAFERVRSRLSEQADLIDRLTRENAEMKAIFTKIERGYKGIGAAMLLVPHNVPVTDDPESTVKLEPEKE